MSHANLPGQTPSGSVGWEKKGGGQRCHIDVQYLLYEVFLWLFLCEWQSWSGNDLLTPVLWDLEMACLPSELQWSCGVRAVREGTMSAEAPKDLHWLVILSQNRANHWRVAFRQSEAGLGSKEKRRGTETIRRPSDVRCSGYVVPMAKLNFNHQSTFA